MVGEGLLGDLLPGQIRTKCRNQTPVRPLQRPGRRQRREASPSRAAGGCALWTDLRMGCGQRATPACLLSSLILCGQLVRSGPSPGSALLGEDRKRNPRGIPDLGEGEEVGREAEENSRPPSQGVCLPHSQGQPKLGVTRRGRQSWGLGPSVTEKGWEPKDRDN